MTHCDICNCPPEPDAKRYPAARMRSAVNTGFRPAAAVRLYTSLANVFQRGVGIEQWVEQVRKDTTDWVLCRSCATELDEHVEQPRRRRWSLFRRR
ncbi:hypothetical protein [Allokutzneria sp. NRRL B-24872]|uniref:hypothetical protein n=1 Tax=Allokutzneria sp. NRRL B-24872 TaxID=1137961 RepID=UPI001FEEE8CF|nr:hypothetical protein [Allokutzneria sp. NRRL B-24872]